MLIGRGASYMEEKHSAEYNRWNCLLHALDTIDILT